MQQFFPVAGIFLFYTDVKNFTTYAHTIEQRSMKKSNNYIYVILKLTFINRLASENL